MPALKNLKHEEFAQALACGMDTTEAFVSVGYTRNMGNANRLKMREEVLKRVAELRGMGAAIAKTLVTVEKLIDEAEEIRLKALRAGSYAAAIAAVKEKGILSGKRVERQELKQVDEFDDMGLSQLRDWVTRQKPVMLEGEIDENDEVHVLEASSSSDGPLNFFVEDEPAKTGTGD